MSKQKQNGNQFYREATNGMKYSRCFICELNTQNYDNSNIEYSKGVEPRRDEIGPVAVLKKYSLVK